jgi:predicted flap endonuclease-1-like 5' DNA nuclease
MTWLMTHMWIALAATGLVTLLLGWSIRGMLLSGKMRQAMVERDMVKVELGEAREEVERLFAAQRKLTNGEAPVAAAPDPILTRKVESLTAELARKSAEIEALKAAANASPAAAVPAAATPATAQVEDTLVWRNRHLESRVVHLEAELQKAMSAAAAMPLVQQVAPPLAAEPVAPAVDTAKLEWEVKYLRTRVEALQTELANVPAPQPVIAAAEPVAEAPAAAAAPETSAPVEEEIARLRWRVRFLEGRLAYFEGDAEAGKAEASAEAEGQDAPAPRAAEAILGQLEAADERAEAEAAKDIARVRPLSLDKPFTEKADDLTLIGGIGPKIQDVLNSLGIFHFDQIAEWTPENVAWVDEYLNFSGRIVREGWVEQAAVLVGEAADA